MLVIKIKTDNAAFGEGDDGDRCAEVARILQAYADKIERTQDLDQRLLDINGNTVGSAAFYE
jgi:hypothetical protein